jgi:hypothetical protein
MIGRTFAHCRILEKIVDSTLPGARLTISTSFRGSPYLKV